jgi:hypothetical protein
MDAMVEMQKAQLQHEKEMRLQSFVVEGQIEKSESINKEIEVPDQSIHSDDKKMEFKTKMVTKKFFVVKFSDGREKEFVDIPSKPINAGEYYQIIYNGMNEITEVTKIEK